MNWILYKKKKAFSNNKTITNYINDFDNDTLNDSLNIKMKNMRTTSKRSESYNNLNYKSFDKKANGNSRKTISANIDDLALSQGNIIHIISLQQT